MQYFGLDLDNATGRGRDEARRAPPHHDDHRRRPGDRGLLRRHAGPAAGQEDRQLRLARRLPPVLRRRDRLARLDPHVVRVPRRRPRPPGHRNDPHAAARRAPPRRRWTSGPSACGERRAAASARCASRTPTASRSSWWWPTTATRRCVPSTPRSRPSTRSPASRARAPTAPSPRSRRECSRRSSASARGRRRVPPAGRGAPLPLGLRPGAVVAGRQGAGTVHHIAWTSRDEDHLAWQESVGAADGDVTEVRDRDYFRSIYFREPRGMLFEIATVSPASPSTRTRSTSARRCRLPSQHEHLRERLERALSPVANPRAASGVHERPRPPRAAGRRRPRRPGRPAPRARRGRARPARPRRRARPGAAAARRHPARAAAAARLAGPPLVRRAARRLPRPDTFHAAFPRCGFHDELWERTGATPGGPCSAASRWAR